MRQATACSPKVYSHRLAGCRVQVAGQAIGVFAESVSNLDPELLQMIFVVGELA
jgi:hypothetical protein